MTILTKNPTFDPVRPGEQWFFYWKTSAALWEGRISQFAPNEVIFLPLYWGFHADAQVGWDFANNQPERDLFRLTQLLTQHGRKFCWILPLTPAPFLPNGGVPAPVARTLSVGNDGVHLAVLDQEDHLNKMFSYFEPKVFGAWGSFLEAFSKFLSQNKIKAPVWGAHFWYFQDEKNYSYLEDTSFAFEQGFSRYLKQNYPEGTELTETKKESALKETFTEDVSKLFLTAAESTLAPYWGGMQNIVTLGGSPRETILRAISNGKSQLEYTRDLFHHFLHHNWITSSLLNASEKNETLLWILNEHFGAKEIEERYNYHSHRGELTTEFRPFGVIDLFGGKKHKHFEKIGLTKFLDHHFTWLYQKRDELIFTPQSIDEHQHKVKFFHGEDLSRTTFSQILKLFLMGQRILLDTSGLSEGLDKKLHIFLLENNIKSQSVNFMTSTQICELGEGKLILFDGTKLLENSSRDKFWLHIFKFLHLVQPQMTMDQDVFSLWRIRESSPHELSYLDVRRVNLYNPTSYKKLVSIKTHKNFAFMKMIDPTRAQAKSTTDGVDVELLPNGKIALDFGHYEET